MVKTRSTVSTFNSDTIVSALEGIVQRQDISSARITVLAAEGNSVRDHLSLKHFKSTTPNPELY